MKPRTNHLAFRRSGFTLMELMVAVAILLAVLALIGTIFATVSKAGGNATSMATLHRQLSQVAEIIERDLQYTSPGPGGAPIGIAGRIIPAHETQRDRDLRNAPTPHRADTLMLFTTAAQDPIYPISTDLAALSQVVYGHADFGKFNVATGQIDLTTIRQLEDTSIPIDQRQPASQWHLARRVIRFLAGPPTGRQPPESPPFGHLTDPQFLTGEAEVWGSISEVKAMFPELFPEHGLLLQFADKKLGGTQDGFPAPNCFYEYLLYNGNLFGRGSDGRWWVLGETGWSRKQYDPNTRQIVSVTSDDGPKDEPNVDTIDDLHRSSHDLCRAVLYDDTAPADTPRRSVIDPKPPLGVPYALRWNFLPACSEFKVEYTYDNPRELALPDNQIDPRSTPIRWYHPRPIRWYSVPDGGQIIWSGLSVNPEDAALTDPCRWPRGIRITLRVWDSAGRLNEPVTRTIVHTW